MSSVSALNSLLSSTPGTNTSASGVNLSSLLAAATGATSIGIDVTSAVDAAIYAARAPERQWQTQQATVQSQITALSSIQSSLVSLTADLNALNDPGGTLAAKVATSSNTSSITATAEANATAGNHTLVVQKLAASASWYSAPLSSGTASLGSSSLQITSAAGTQKTFALGTSGLNSLNDLASAINTASLGLNASVVTDAVGSRLALVSQTSGAAANFTLSNAPVATSTWTSASVATASSGLEMSTFQVNDGTSTASVSVAAGSTLTSLANQLNSLGLNLTAGVVTDSSGAHLSVSSPSGNPVQLSADPTLVMTQSSAGQDAVLQVDGVPIRSATNTVKGAVPGITFNLQGAATGTAVTIAVSADAGQITSSLTQFVTHYNAAIKLLNAQFAYDTTANSQGVLGSDSAVRSLQSVLLGITGQTQTQTSGTSQTTSLASLGISVGSDGSLTLDSTKLNQAITKDPGSIQNFFQGAALNGFAHAAVLQLKTFSNPATGVLAADAKTLAQQYQNLQNNVINLEAGYIASQKTVLTTMYSKAEIALQQLPTTLKQLQAQLGNNSSGG